MTPYSAETDVFLDLLEQQRIVIAEQRRLIELLSHEITMALTRGVQLPGPAPVLR